MSSFASLRMRGLREWTMRFVLAVSAFVVPSPPASAQSVLVQVLSAETSQPLLGAVAHLISPSGEVVTSRLSNRTGRVLFAGVEGGRYSVRAEMIGHSAAVSEVFGVVAGGSVPLVLRLEPRAIPLAGVEVTAGAGPCRVRPREEGLLLAAVWDEARKALSATAVADQLGIYRYSLVMYEQEMDEDGVITAEEQTRRQGYMRSPFGSLAVEELTTEGFVHLSATDWTYFAPDAQTLLSDPFLDAHCFRLVNGGPEQGGLVGLSFEPTGENEGVADISGTLWLDRDSVALRWLEYTYENLEPDVRPGDATGRVEFQRMPEGTWIVPEWWIRTPLVLVEVGRRDRRRIVGYRQTGGRVQEAVAAGGRDLARGVTTAGIEGIVVDSLGVPIQGVGVGSVGSSQTIFTNAEGRFNLVSLLEGSYRVRFSHPDIEALGLQPPEITQDVLGGVSAYVEFLMPSQADILRSSCGTEATSSTGTLGGTVRDASTGAPVQGAAVSVTWSQIELSGAPGGLIGRESYAGFETTTDRFGVYRFCSVPRRQELTLVSRVDGVEGTEQTFSLSGDEAARMQVIRHATSAGQRAQLERVAPVEPETLPPPNGRFTKAGRVRDATTNAVLDSALVQLPQLDLRLISDVEGRISFRDLPPGEHVLRVERLGYEVMEGTFEVSSGQDFVVLLDRMEMPDNEEPGAIVGRVTDERGQAVTDADISVVGQQSAGAVSSRQGRFEIDDLAPGVVEVRFERLGYTSRTAQFVVQAGRTAELSVVMPAQAIELEPITVMVRSRVLERGGFYERRDGGFGTQFDRQDIERIDPELVYDVVRRVPGLRVNDPRRSDPTGRGAVVGAPSYAANGRAVATLGSPSALTRPPRVPTSDRSCYLTLFIDGVRMADPDLQQIQPAFIEALEVYTGRTGPAEYQLNNPCGAILIWTRR